MTKLKPYPFCGGEVELVMSEWRDNPYNCYIFCPHCCFESGIYSKPEYVVEKWNRRVDNG